MYKNKKVLAVVPARGGSKGIPLKNIQKVGGVPLVGIVGQVASGCPMLDRVVVSTDHPHIAAVAKEYHIDVPFMRPEELSGDRIADLPVLRHALSATEADDGALYDVVVMLQPTSPLRRPEHVEQTVRRLIDDALDAAWTVSETDSKGHPLKQLLIKEDGTLDYYDAAGREIIARQQLAPVYHRNGVAYALTRDFLLGSSRGLLGCRTGAVLINEEMPNIDTLFDLEMADYLLRQNKKYQRS